MPTAAENVATLEAALATGERRVRFGDRDVEYRDVEQLKAAILYWKREAAAESGVQRAVHYFTPALRRD
jgi:hypothetical protein